MDGFQPGGQHGGIASLYGQAEPLEGVEDNSRVILPLCPGHGSSHLLDLLDPLLREAPRL